MVEQLSTSHHRRRLRHVGWAAAMDPPEGGWAEAAPPARRGNALEVLIDGAHALQAIAVAIAAARAHVHIAGWHLTPDFALTRHETPTILRELLAVVAARLPVRVLIWAGAPLPVLRPWRGDGREVRDQLMAGSRIQCALDARERPMHCHHEKTIVIDDRIAFVGGIDLTNFHGDRWDTQDHPPRAPVGWHDVAARITGPAVQDVAQNFAMRWEATTGEKLPRPRCHRPPATSSCSWCGPSRTACTVSCPAENSGSSSRTCAACEPRNVLCISRISFSGRPRSWRCCVRSSRDRQRP